MAVGLGTLAFMEVFFGRSFVSIEYQKARIAKKRQAEEESGHPYRRPAKVDLYNDEPIKEPEVKAPKAKSIKLPKINWRFPEMPKAMVVFLYLLPAMLTDIGLGFVYDSNSLGSGSKWGFFAAGVITNIFFIVCACSRAESSR